ncbi:sulfotransferase family protein [Fodinibius sediminis]|uniref:Sulfotransferase domain-containing protein n=1 Tax=Fodinibius sediminis TaxID=1214077 RepID=A0A521ETY0_9BACT|nr:sulfotransferase [Fodinibius sediminis]SMO87354.1 Sulfotransferase domain-containing protein [Fodinibius sediminis]
MERAFNVDFMVVGAQKCGTTSLAQMLSSHDAIVCCDKKEPMFFSSVDNWREELSDYHALFKWREGALHYEASTSYTCYPYHNRKIWEDLYAYNPDLKIIYIVRNPVDRIVSSYMHTYKRGYTDLGMERALVEEPMLLDMTRYATQIRPFIEQFGADQVQILFFEDLVRDRSIIMQQLASFLGIAMDGFPDMRSFHANRSVENFKIHHKYDQPGIIMSGIRRYFPPLWKIITDNSGRSFKQKPRLSPADQEMILYLLRKEIEELEEMTGRDLSGWRAIREKETAGKQEDYRLTWYEAKVKLFSRIKRKVRKLR